MFSKLKGTSNGDNGKDSASSGWSALFPAIASGIAAESVNYSVTAARGIFTIPASFILTKLGYRKACLLACGLATTALPLIFSPHWTVLIVGRIIMAAGGTLTIIYISPLLSKLTLPAKRKKLAALNGFTFAISGLVVNVLFMIQSISTFLTTHWRWVSATSAIMSFIPLLLFYRYGGNFEISSLSEKLKVRIPDNYETLLRDKEAWTWIITYSFLLVVSILFSSFVPGRLSDLIPSIKTSLSGLDWSSLYTVIFFVGTCCGLYVLGRFNLQDVRRTSIVSLAIKLTIASWGLITVAAVIYNSTQSVVANILMLIGVFCLSFFGLGVQSVLLYIPLEYKNYSPQKTATFFSCLWGIGYIILTLYYILSSALNQLAGAAYSLIFITALLVLFYFFTTRLRESRPEFATFWNWRRQRRLAIQGL
ncbi:MFS transporter [Candidatus Mycoplasma haematominutum]|uniref:MFS transporter n=1 Tax=Candidatus Mycoplasma haematominutum TaxID=209446 RepID=UPI001FDF7A17|nr:MFS transporter [Candidatus Mycoplasma haematominutum]